MTTHRLRATLEVDRPIDEVFAFFSRPENLGRITPPAMGFELLSTDLRDAHGLEIEYRIRPLLGHSAHVAQPDRRLRSAARLPRRPDARAVPALGPPPHVHGGRGRHADHR